MIMIPPPAPFYVWKLILILKFLINNNLPEPKISSKFDVGLVPSALTHP